MAEFISTDGIIYAIIVRNGEEAKDVEFYTPNSFSQQLGSFTRSKGYIVNPHYHLENPRQVLRTQEVLIIRRGRIRIDFFELSGKVVCCSELGAGDVVLLADGAHGLEVLEDAAFLEVKQGPYDPVLDKRALKK